MEPVLGVSKEAQQARLFKQKILILLFSQKVCRLRHLSSCSPLLQVLLRLFL
jgi:hypothetical protein